MSANTMRLDAWSAAGSMPERRKRRRRMVHNPRMTLDPDAHLMSLIDRVAAQDQAALKELYDTTSSKLYGLSMRVVRNPEWAEDALQDAYLQIWRSAADYRASLSPPMA